MTRHHAGERPDPSVPGDWSDAPSRDALQLIAEGVTQVAGFGVAAISVVREDGLLEVMAVAGNDEARDHLTGVRTPIDVLMAEIEKADHWGLLRFLPHERLDLGGEDWGWVPDIKPIDDPDAWHPMDLLLAPLRSDDGILRGTLTMDLPQDGRRPGEAQRAVLQKYAEQAGRAVVTALEREELAEQVRLADAARTIVRKASAQQSLGRVLADSREALTDGFRATGMWIHTFLTDGPGAGAMYASAGNEMVVVPSEVIELARVAAQRGWHLQRSEIVSPERPMAASISAEQTTEVLAFLDQNAIGSILFTPLGAGSECLGSLVLTRGVEDPEWTEVEAAAALDIGHDLGRAILNARTFERERQFIADLRELDAYKSRLISTVAHELKNPLAIVAGHRELLDSSPDLTDDDRTSLTFMERGIERMQRVIADLLMLSRVADPRTDLTKVPVDLGAVARDVAEFLSTESERRDIAVIVDVPAEPVLTPGDPDELDRAVSNLLSNALKYTQCDRSVTIAVSANESGVVLTCSDEGLGISTDDQQQLFTEFFRSTNPEALVRPGTGLGLTIVKRIVERHDGQIEVESKLGVGSTFRMRLPALPA